MNKDVAEELASKLRNASLVLLPSGHWLQIDQPEDVARAMLDRQPCQLVALREAIKLNSLGR